ncbi:MULTISPECIES: universal stress protein [unclassified Chelatococcus]|uniref:universal stress protein n=1 Tax=unclassified Chelatococcus TaxID=2638111 RepID=UPI001BCABB0D|nr:MULTISPECIES: universal stress protein [unclassified Chelatococcus]MBS7696996.1 universal stress protein [Chelatococcus sp. YT9]MBX3555986.1 universal stress protein [Chelatococcus sp.]
MGKPRRAYEAGHHAKFLAIVDDSPECERAIHFAARRAVRTGVSLVLLCIKPEADMQDWLGVGDVMRAEAEDDAAAALERAAAYVRGMVGLEPECATRIGVLADELVKFIDDDEDIALLVLAAGTGSDGPGPLVSALASRTAASFPVPVAIVPGHLSTEEIDALA